ncbi:MAG: hypothetical protein RQ754_03370 [Desulfuromonadales bacterium]|jgi:hypothetical protein|nr:hypothetical protein [Desulfuromonadales bacterium]
MTESKQADILKYPSRFGMAAVKLGFVSQDQLREAMLEQLDINLDTGVHRLIGEILHEKGWMTLEQVKSTLENMD